ncbi:hypothetical protein [Haloferax larsenii]|uniref:Uncharacterized protein n=1 Tax=Haloferax larsenii TaxID=302484 RepID=A0A1H7GI42_HALLR|nr:hypothetical protein [Haloferax larsenii]SEK35505.1 hypothetical protein SAMN04488691_101270 [Haloferax larsenii]
MRYSLEQRLNALGVVVFGVVAIQGFLLGGSAGAVAGLFVAGAAAYTVLLFSAPSRDDSGR